MASCTKCTEKAVFQSNEGPLCRTHFTQWYEKEVQSTMEKYSMISSKDRICVGFSGGKDSTVLLTVLAHLNLDAELIAITVDEGIGGYRDDTIAAARKTASTLGIEHQIISFRDIIGKTLDELLVSSPEAACSVCGTLRRRALNKAAREVNADKIATGHCLDDEAQSVIMNYLRGDITRVTASFHSNSKDLFLPRIKPLSRVTERATVAYGLANGILTVLPECPYTRYALRKDVRFWLGEQEHKKPGTLLAIVTGQEELINNIPESLEETTILHPCEICGEPTANKICAACQQLNRILH